MRISEFLIKFFFAWTLATLVTSRGHNFNLSNLNRLSNFSSRPQLSYKTLFVAQKWNSEELDYVFSKRAESAHPPCIFNWLKSPHLLGLKLIFIQIYSEKQEGHKNLKKLPILFDVSSKEVWIFFHTFEAFSEYKNFKSYLYSNILFVKWLLALPSWQFLLPFRFQTISDLISELSKRITLKLYIVEFT